MHVPSKTLPIKVSYQKSLPGFVRAAIDLISSNPLSIALRRSRAAFERGRRALSGHARTISAARRLASE